MKSWPYMPGVPAAGHVTAAGWWHPGRSENCSRCAEPQPPILTTHNGRVVALPPKKESNP